MKKRFLIVTTLMLGMCQIVPAYASTMVVPTAIEGEIMPLYEHAKLVSTSIRENSGDINCALVVTLKESGEINATMELQRKVASGWKTIETWKYEENGIKLSKSESIELSDTNNLRVYSTVDITVEGITETIIAMDEL